DVDDDSLSAEEDAPDEDDSDETAVLDLLSLEEDWHEAAEPLAAAAADAAGRDFDEIDTTGPTAGLASRADDGILADGDTSMGDILDTFAEEDDLSGMLDAALTLA